MSKPLTLRIPSAEAQLIRDIAKMLGRKPGTLALDIFRLGVKHMELDSVKMRSHFMGQAIQSQIQGLAEAFSFVKSVVTTAASQEQVPASQEQVPASQEQSLLLKSSPPASQEQTCTGTLVHSDEYCPLHDGAYALDNPPQCTGHVVHSEYDFCPVHR